MFDLYRKSQIPFGCARSRASAAQVSLGFFGGEKKEPKLAAGANVFESMQGGGGEKRAASMGKLSAMDELMRENEEKKRRTMEKAEPVVKDEPAEAEDAPWVAPGLVVKVAESGRQAERSC